VRKGVIARLLPLSHADVLRSTRPRRSKAGGSSSRARAIISRSFIRRSLTWASPLKIAERAGAERREIKKEHEKHL
jgi:hypothetical protein